VSIPEVQSRSRLLAFLKNFFAEKSSTSKAAPTDASYLTLGTNGDLSAERVLTAGDNITFTDGGAGGTLTIDASGGGGGGISWDGSTADGVATYKNASEASVEANLTFDGTTLALAGNQTIITSNEGLTNDRALFVQNTADHCNIEIDAAASHEANIVFSENTSIKWAIGNAESNDDLQFRINGWAQKAALSQTGDLQIDGDLTVTGNDIKGSGGTVITMDATNDVNLAGDLTVNGGDLFIKSTAVADLFFRRETASLVDGDDLGNIIFQATENGTNIAWSPAVIKAECSETFVEGSNEGTRLKFLTTPNGTAASTTNMILDGNGNLDIDGALTLGAGVTSALGSEITTDLSTVDEWTKVAEADLNDPLYASYQMATATINVLLVGYEGSEEMYLATCNILAHKYGPTKSHLQVDIIQDEGSVAWDTSDFSLTQNTSVAELWVKAPAANHTCYATITNGTTGGNTQSPSAAKSDWILTPNQTWGSLVPLTDTATTTNVKKRFDSLVIDSDLTMGAATSYIRDAQGHQRISIAGTGDIVLYDASGGTEFTVTNGSCTVSGDLFVNDYARIDALRIGTTSLDPGVDGNLYIEGATTAVGQITPGFDPGLIAQQILDPSGYALYGIVEDLSYLRRVVWHTGDTSCTDPSVTFTAPVSGRVMVEVSCYMDNAPSPTYVYAALSTSSGTKITTTDASIAGVQKFVWGPDEADKGTREFRFYVGGLSGGSSYTYYLYLRITNTQTTRVICGGDYPVFEMSVRPTLAAADVYSA